MFLFLGENICMTVFGFLQTVFSTNEVKLFIMGNIGFFFVFSTKLFSQILVSISTCGTMMHLAVTSVFLRKSLIVGTGQPFGNSRLQF